MTVGSVPTSELDTPSEEQRPQRVEIAVPVRTLLQLLIFGALVALAVLSLGTLLSIFLAAVVALGLDPLVSALVRRKIGRASCRERV